jgi:glycosyltransferase involved in cell wall biosynthesis
MKIAFIEPHLELYGGIRRIMELSNRLTRIGDDVTIFHPAGTPCAWMEGLAKTRPTADIMHDAYDAVIFNDPPHYTLARRVRAAVKAFYVLGLDDHEKLRRFSLRVLWPRKGRLASRRRALSLPFLKISNSSWIQMYLRDALGIDSALVVGGINRDVFRPVRVERPRGVFRILWSGDPRESKGGDTIRDACDRVRREHGEVELFTYHGQGIPQDKMAETICAADLFVDAQCHAGWNNPVAEAMACGVPVACTDIGGVIDFAFHEETALLFPVGRADRLASAIRRLIADVELRNCLRRNALNHIARFEWDRSARRLRRVLETYSPADVA